MKNKKDKTTQKDKLIKTIDEFELQPLNHELYNDYSIEELEERLETKPWVCGAYVECGVDDNCGVNDSCAANVGGGRGDAPIIT